MTPLAIDIHAALRKRGRRSAAQLALDLDQPIEAIYAALVQLEDSEQAYTATQRAQPRERRYRTARLWEAREIAS